MCSEVGHLVQCLEWTVELCAPSSLSYLSILSCISAFQSEGHTRCSYRIDFELLVDQNGEPVMPPKGLWLTSSDLPTMMPTGSVDPSPQVRGRTNTSSDGSVHDGLELLKSAGWTSAKGEVTPYGPHQRRNKGSTHPSALSSVALNTLINDLTQYHRMGRAEGEVVPSSSSSQVTQTPDLPMVNLASDWSPAFTGGHVEGCHRVAVEADGPYHFHQSPEGYSLTGGTHLKRRQLAAMGWKVLPVSGVCVCVCVCVCMCVCVSGVCVCVCVCVCVVRMC